jgi:glycosyltransferase involved in cell wall biosynthesis
MEAAATGVPIVACDIRGCRQVVDHGTTGLLGPVRDAAALQANIERLLDDHDLRAQMSAAALAKARTGFDQQTVIARTLAAYKAR